MAVTLGDSPPIYLFVRSFTSNAVSLRRAVPPILLLGAWTMWSVHQESHERCGAREDALYGSGGESPVGR